MKISVIIPAYKVVNHIVELIEKIGDEVHEIIVIDDCCPDGSGLEVKKNVRDSRVRVIFNESNMGVGGAVLVGYKYAIANGADIAVKLDGDGQMDPALIGNFIDPIVSGYADYTKGNRFYNLEKIRRMPKARLFGNACLSFLTKLSSGYWDVFDPTNGYTAIHMGVAKNLPLEKVSRRYFFESDMLFRLGILRAVVTDIPIDANYGNEVSNLKISNVIGEFFWKNLRNFLKRIFYNYYLRDVSLASIELPIGLIMLLFGISYGGYHWMLSVESGSATATGTVVLSAMTITLGLQFILAFLAYDISSIPKRVLHRNKREP